MPQDVPQSRARLAQWLSATLTPLELPEGLLTLRAPRLADGPDWSAARLANREWLERAFPAWGDDWATEQSEVAWAQRWARLSRLRARGQAKPFVMRLDGVLIGEIGVDAVDTLSGAGEASVWMVRSHGSAAVMNTASVLLIEHAFAGRSPIERMISPVATSSRRGRSPGLRAVGFEIEATIPRRVGAAGLVDHDIWVLHNTIANRRRAMLALRGLRAATPPDLLPPPTPTDRPRAAATAGRATLRAARAAVRRDDSASTPRRGAAERRLRGPEGTVGTLRPTTRRDRAALGGAASLPGGTTCWTVVGDDGFVAAVVGHRFDAGSATTEVYAVARPGGARELLAAGLGSVLDDVRPGPDEPRVVLVRVGADAAPGTVPDDEMLSESGLERVATYRPHPEAGRHWNGEDVWRWPSQQ